MKRSLFLFDKNCTSFLFPCQFFSSCCFQGLTGHLLSTIALVVSMSLDTLHGVSQPQEKDNLQFYLDKHALELTPDGKFVRWSAKNRRHPRHWSTLKKVYNSILIVWFDFFTYLFLQWQNCLVRLYR